MSPRDGEEMGRPDGERMDRRPVVTALVLGALALLMGLSVWDAVVVTVAAAVLTVALVVLGTGQEYPWPEARLDAAAGTRREVAAITWSLIGRDGRVSEAAVRRLRADATRRLGARGVHLPGGLNASTPSSPVIDDDAREAARRLLGDRAWAILTAPGGWMPSLTDIAHCVEVIERLGTAHVPPATRGRP